MLLMRLTGPECPRCGFERSTLLASTERRRYDGRQLVSQETIERRECEDCGRRYQVTAEPPRDDAVAVQPIRCPDCDSATTRVTSSPLPVRYHHCEDCGRNFKSLET